MEYSKNARVMVFYRMNAFGSDEFNVDRKDYLRAFYTENERLAILTPRMGFTQRWVPATIVSKTPKCSRNPSFTSNSVRVKLDFREHWYDWSTGAHINFNDIPPNASINSAEKYQIMPLDQNAARSLGIPPPLKVTVSFVIFRWSSLLFYGREREPAEPVASWSFIETFFRDFVQPKLGEDYEVFTVFIGHSHELENVSEHYIRSQCQGTHVCALYFLNPADNQQSFLTGVWSLPASVETGHLLPLINRMESVGIVTQWPNHYNLFKTLVSRSWLTTLSMDSSYHIPLTTRVTRAQILTDPRQAAIDAVRALIYLQRARASNPELPPNPYWDLSPNASLEEIEHLQTELKPVYETQWGPGFRGLQELEEGFRMIALGQPNSLMNSFLVQQKIPEVNLEIRAFLVNHKVVKTTYVTKNILQQHEKVAVSQNEAISHWFSGDAGALAYAESQIALIITRVTIWLRAECIEPAVSMRMDFSVCHASPGVAYVWLTDICPQMCQDETGSIDQHELMKGLMTNLLSFLPVQNDLESMGEQFSEGHESC